MFRILYCSLLSLMISLTLGQSKSSQFINYSPRRTYEQILFEKSKIESQYYGFNRFQPQQSNQQTIESRSSSTNQNTQVNQNLSDESNNNGKISLVNSQNSNAQSINQNHATNSLVLSAPSSSSLNLNEEKLNEQFVPYNYKNQNNQQPHTSYTFHQLHPHQQHTHQKQPKHSYYSSNYNNQPINTNLINKNNDNEEHQLNHNLNPNHYDLDTPIYHNQNVQNYQPNNLNSRLHNPAHLSSSSSFSTTQMPILSLKNTKVDGKLSPTLIITLPKKRKSSNGKLRRFPFLKAIVNSFISTDRRSNTPNDQGKQVQSNKNKAVSAKLEHSNDYTNSNFNNQQNQQSVNQQQQNQRKQQQQIYPLSTSSNNVQMRSQPMTASSDVNNQSNQNVNPNTNLNSNSNENNLTNEQQHPKEEKITSSEFDDNNFSLPTKDDDLEDDEEDDFTEHSDAPRPANFDENQYYIESNKIKYSSSREPIKQNDSQAQSTNQSSNQNSSNQKKANKFVGSNTSSDFESKLF